MAALTWNNAKNRSLLAWRQSLSSAVSKHLPGASLTDYEASCILLRHKDCAGSFKKEKCSAEPHQELHSGPWMDERVAALGKAFGSSPESAKQCLLLNGNVLSWSAQDILRHFRSLEVLGVPPEDASCFFTEEHRREVQQGLEKAVRPPGPPPPRMATTKPTGAVQSGSGGKVQEDDTGKPKLHQDKAASAQNIEQRESADTETQIGNAT
ncbi:unnamed protein product [Amoebophrya sp. A120]|nr:unnamed protein product [Amoebophrya sp. A120]|eukprot:GSA120T00012983001.1